MDSFEKEYAKRMQGARKSSYTFAPEAGTQRLRDVINKNVTEEDLLRAARYAFESGATSIKLYFMIGLPTETFEDLDGIVHLVKKVITVYSQTPRELRQGALKLHVSTSSFVPKPFTPFQWEPQDDIELLRQKQEYLRDRLKPLKGVKYNWHDSRTSFLEAVFGAAATEDFLKCFTMPIKTARCSIAGRIISAWNTGRDAFEKAGIDPHFYANRRRDVDEVLPYDHIDCYVSKNYLKRELDRAKKSKTNARLQAGCTGCGFEKRCNNAHRN